MDQRIWHLVRDGNTKEYHKANTLSKDMITMHRRELRCHQVDGACFRHEVIAKLRRSMPELEYKKCATKLLDDLKWHEKQCSFRSLPSRPMAKSTCSHETEILNGWKREIYYVGNTSTGVKHIRNGFIAGGSSVQQGCQATYFSAAHRFSEHMFPNEDSLEPQIIPYHHKKPWNDALCTFSLSEAHQFGLDFLRHKVGA